VPSASAVTCRSCRISIGVRHGPAAGKQIDILAANAGGGSFQQIGVITEEALDETFAINVKGTLFTVQKALPLPPDGASIILTSCTRTRRALPGVQRVRRDPGDDSQLRAALGAGSAERSCSWHRTTRAS